MKLIEQSWEWMQKPELPLEFIEAAGRTCYKSEDKIDEGSAKKFVSKILRSGHESVIEHVSASVRFITNRGVTHELVRHRLCAYSQESTRYVDYADNIEFVLPVWVTSDAVGSVYETGMAKFIESLESSERAYRALRDEGWRPEQAREVLPNALKTEIVMTANLREWRHVFRLRTSKAAHPQIRSLMRSCLLGFQDVIPVLFDDL